MVTGGPLRPGGVALTAEIMDICRPGRGSAVLDVGCGPGHTLALLASKYKLRPTGLDPSASMLARAVTRAPGARLLQGRATAIPCGQLSFEMVIAECVLSLTGDIEMSLGEMYTVLRPGGVLVVTDIYKKRSEISADLPDINSCISHARPLTDIEKGVAAAGFKEYRLFDRSELLRQLAGQIIFDYGSLEKFWQLFMAEEAARRTCCAVTAAPLGYYVLIAEKGAPYG